MLTNEVSIDVMWKFVKSQMSEDEFIKRLKDGTSGSQLSRQTIKNIKEKPAMDWDVSTLSSAILHFKDLKLDDSQEKSVKKLRDIRNMLFHKRAQIDFEEYVEVLRESMESYKGLLDEDPRLVYVKQLEDIHNRETYNFDICHSSVWCIGGQAR